MKIKEARLITRDARYAAISTFKDKQGAFAFVNIQELDVPCAIVLTFGSNGPSTRFLSYKEFVGQSLMIASE